jgi:hypothetical protein
MCPFVRKIKDVAPLGPMISTAREHHDIESMPLFRSLGKFGNEVSHLVRADSMTLFLNNV